MEIYNEVFLEFPEGYRYRFYTEDFGVYVEIQNYLEKESRFVAEGEPFCLGDKKSVTKFIEALQKVIV